MSGRFEGMVSVITGGTSGIGLATGKRFAAEGARVYITGLQQAELCAAVAAIGPMASGVQADSTRSDDLDRLYERIEKEARRIDILVVNAGRGSQLALGSITEQHYDNIFDLNVKGVLFTVQKALPLLREGASVILVSSTAGSKGAPGSSVYSASKAAIRNLARSWTLDLKSRGIRVNVISPGPIKTPLLLGLAGVNPADQQAFLELLASRVPLGRVGEPEEVASAAAFLASSDASYIAGSELFVDGGFAQV